MTNGMTGGSNNATVGPNTNNTINETIPSSNNMTPGETFHPMFVAVADFMREKCVACHDQGQNGNIVVPPNATNETLMMNLDGVVATSGRLPYRAQ